MSICEYVNDIVEVFNKSSIQNKKVTIRDENNNTYELHLSYEFNHTSNGKHGIFRNYF